MTRAQLIADLAASNPHLRVADVEFIVGAIFDQITATLARGGRVQMRGFGTFTVKRRNARMGRNPRSGEPARNCVSGSIAEGRSAAPHLTAATPAGRALVPARARRVGRKL